MIGKLVLIYTAKCRLAGVIEERWVVAVAFQRPLPAPNANPRSVTASTIFRPSISLGRPAPMMGKCF